MMFTIHTRKDRAGFTLVEMLVVVAILGIFTSLGVVVAKEGRQRARDNERKVALEQLKVALELYRDKYGGYPGTGGNFTSSGLNDNAGLCNQGTRYCGGDKWIPNLVSSGFIASLPQDPLGGMSKLPLPSTCIPYNQRAYLYKSDGALDGSNATQYVLLAHCSPERTISPSDPYYDPIRPSWAFKVCTPARFDTATNSWVGGCAW